MSAIVVEIVYATPANTFCEEVTLAKGECIKDAITKSSFLSRYPKLELAKLAVGVFSRERSLEHELADGDRVEIYRPLQYRYAQRQR